jgi:hypothetical protein
MMPDKRERIHVGCVVVAIAARHGIAVAAVHHDPPRPIAEYPIGRRDQAAGFDASQPILRQFGKALGGIVILALQRHINVVIVDEYGAEDRSLLITLHLARPAVAFTAGIVTEHLSVSRANPASAGGPRNAKKS